MSNSKNNRTATLLLGLFLALVVFGPFAESIGKQIGLWLADYKPPPLNDPVTKKGEGHEAKLETDGYFFQWVQVTRSISQRSIVLWCECRSRLLKSRGLQNMVRPLNFLPAA